MKPLNSATLILALAIAICLILGARAAPDDLISEFVYKLKKQDQTISYSVSRTDGYFGIKQHYEIIPEATYCLKGDSAYCNNSRGEFIRKGNRYICVAKHTHEIYFGDSLGLQSIPATDPMYDFDIMFRILGSIDPAKILRTKEGARTIFKVPTKDAIPMCDTVIVTFIGKTPRTIMLKSSFQFKGMSPVTIEDSISILSINPGQVKLPAGVFDKIDSLSKDPENLKSISATTRKLKELSIAMDSLKKMDR